jgi:hypothetical protein
MDTSNCIQQPNKQKDVTIRNKVKEEDAESGNSSTDSVG